MASLKVKKGFLGEFISLNGTLFIRYHAITDDWHFFKSHLSTYHEKGYIDIAKDHLDEQQEKLIKIYLHDTKSQKIGIIGIGVSDASDASEYQEHQKYQEYKDIVSYVFQIALNKKNDAKYRNRFLHNISNAIRNPVDSIININLALNQIPLCGLTPVQKQYIELTSFYSMKLLDVVNDINDYTRLSSGDFQFVNKTMDIRRCIHTVQSIIDQKITQGVKLTFECAEDMPETIISDEIRLTQILVNLLDNSCKFTKTGFINLSLKYLKDAEKTYISITITDTGIGMSEEQIQGVFTETFFRPDAKDNPNIGLGLLIVKKLIDFLKGTITIESDVLTGTVVKIKFPVLDRFLLSRKEISTSLSGKNLFIYSKEKIKINFQDYGLKVTHLLNIKDVLKHVSSIDIIMFHKTTKEEVETIISKISTKTQVIITEEFQAHQIYEIEKDPYYISLPLSEVKIANILTNIILDKELSKSSLSLLSHFKGRILIAENDKKAERLLIEYLTKLGYNEIETVSDGLELYGKLTQNPLNYYKIAFITINIPIIDGISVFKKLNLKDSKDDKLSNMIIIAVSSEMTQAIKEQCYAVGMNGYIIKPISLKDLEKLEVMILK